MQQRVQRFGLHGQALSDELVGQADALVELATAR
jgi:hypothetical protein